MPVDKATVTGSSHSKSSITIGGFLQKASSTNRSFLYKGLFPYEVISIIRPLPDKPFKYQVFSHAKPFQYEDNEGAPDFDNKENTQGIGRVSSNRGNKNLCVLESMVDAPCNSDVSGSIVIKI